MSDIKELEYKLSKLSISPKDKNLKQRLSECENELSQYKKIKKPKEFKEEKEGKKVAKLRDLIRKHFPKAKKLKIVEDDNKFFFWKDLIQQYSSKKSMCIFLEDTDLLPFELRKKLIYCIVNELENAEEFGYRKQEIKDESLIFHNIKQIFFEVSDDIKIDRNEFDKEIEKYRK